MGPRETEESKSYIIDLNPEGGDPFNSVQSTQDTRSLEREIMDNQEPPEQNQDELEDNSQPIREEPEMEEDIDVSDEEAEEQDDLEEHLGEQDYNPNDPSLEEGEEEEADVNPYFYLGQQLKQDGFLDEDITEDVTGADIYSKYREKLEEELKPQVVQSIYSELASQGINDQDITLARAIRQGVDLRLLSEVTTYDKYASTPDDAPADDKIQAIKAMYLDRNFKENEAQKLIDTIESEDSIDEAFSETKEYFGQKYAQFVENEQRRVEEQQRMIQEQEQRVNERVRSLLGGRELMGEPISKEQAKEIENAIYNPDRIVNIQNQQYRATELQQFLLEFNNSEELKLFLFKKWKYRDQDEQNIKNKAKDEAEQELLAAYKKAVVKDKNATRKKKVKNKLDTNKKNSNSYII